MASERYKFLTEHEKEQEEKALENLESQKKTTKNARPNAQKQLYGSGYFSKDNVKDYQKELIAHLFGKKAPEKKGRGYFFETVEELNEWIQKYFNLCVENEVVPTISGLVTYLKCNKQTLYDHANNPTSPFYQSCRDAIDYCHVCLESGASESQLNSVAYIFQAKNYFNMRDVQEVQVTPNQGQIQNNTETLQALKDQLQQENPTKQIDMREAVYTEVEK